MDHCIKVTYGNYEFDAAPLLTMQTSQRKDKAGFGYGLTHNINLNGFLLSTGAKEVQSGVIGVFREIESLQQAFSQDGMLLTATWTSGDNGTGLSGVSLAYASGTILSGYPKITDLNIQSPDGNNFTSRVNYDIGLEMICLNSGGTGEPAQWSSPHPPYIEEVDDKWDFEIVNFGGDSFMFSGTGDRFYFEGGGQTTIQVTHTLNVQARLSWTGIDEREEYVGTGGGVKKGYPVDPWISAKKWTTGVLYSGLNTTDQNGKNTFYRFFQASGITSYTSGMLNKPDLETNGAAYLGGVGRQLKFYDHVRNVSYNKSQGAIDVSEVFLVRTAGTGTGPGGENDVDFPGATETFSITSNKEGGVFTATVQGEIQGHYHVQYGLNGQPLKYGTDAAFGGNESKYNNASTYFGMAFNRIANRASGAIEEEKQLSLREGEGGGCFNSENSLKRIKFNPIPESRSVTRSPSEGKISYEATYSTKQIGIDVTGLDPNSKSCVLSQNITLEQNYGTDRFAEHIILGRAAGPLFQSLGTKTAPTTTITIEMTVVPPESSDYATTGVFDYFPTGATTAFLANITGVWNDPNSEVLITQDTETFGLFDGTYTRVYAYTYGGCS